MCLANDAGQSGKETLQHYIAPMVATLAEPFQTSPTNSRAICTRWLKSQRGDSQVVCSANALSQVVGPKQTVNW